MERNALWLVLFAVVLLPLAVSVVHAQGSLFSATSTAQAVSQAASDNGAALISPVPGSLASGDRNMERAASTRSVDGQLTAETHRGILASSAASLLQIAALEDPANGLGERLRVVAQELEDAEPAATEAIEKIAYRSAIDSLFGGNARDIALLKTALAELKSDIDQLKAIEGAMAGPVDTAALDTQVAALEEDAAILTQFIASHS